MKCLNYLNRKSVEQIFTCFFVLFGRLKINDDKFALITVKLLGQRGHCSGRNDLKNDTTLKLSKIRIRLIIVENMHDMHKIIDFERSQTLHFKKLTGIAQINPNKLLTEQ